MNKIILIDATNTFVIKGEGVFSEMFELLEKYPNNKIILTNANDEEVEKFGLTNLPYQVFSLKHNPNKTEQKYYVKMLKHFNLEQDDVVCIEHNEDAVKSSRSVGIITYHYNKDKKDLKELKKFLDKNL